MKWFLSLLFVLFICLRADAQTTIQRFNKVVIVSNASDALIVTGSETVGGNLTVTGNIVATGTLSGASFTGALVLTDVTTNDVTTSAHGFAPKLPGTTTTFFRGDGTYVVLPTTTDAMISFSDITTGNATASQHGFLPKIPGTTTTFLRGDATFTAVPADSDATLTTTDITTNNATSSKHGFLPKLPGNTTTFLRGDGTFVIPSVSVTDADVTFTDITTGNATTSAHGFMKKFDGNAYNSVKGDGNFGHTFVRGTITTSDPFTWSQTWNNASTVFSGVEVNVTPTLFDIDSSYFSVNDTIKGQAFAVKRDPINAGLSMFVFNNNTDSIAQSTDFAIHSTSGGISIGDGSGNAATMRVYTAGVQVGPNWTQGPAIFLADDGGSGSTDMRMGADVKFKWTSGANAFNGSLDTGLVRFAPGILRATLNPATGFGGGFAVGDTAANSPQPTCDATVRGTLWAIYQGAGVKDNVQVCAKDSGDAYAWRTIY